MQPIVAQMPIRSPSSLLPRRRRSNHCILRHPHADVVSFRGAHLFLWIPFTSVLWLWGRKSKRSKMETSTSTEVVQTDERRMIEERLQSE
jgi:hypothetical protein